MVPTKAGRDVLKILTEIAILDAVAIVIAPEVVIAKEMDLVIALEIEMAVDWIVWIAWIEWIEMSLPPETIAKMAVTTVKTIVKIIVATTITALSLNNNPPFLKDLPLLFCPLTRP